MQEILAQHIRLGHDAGGRNVFIFSVLIGGGAMHEQKVPLKFLISLCCNFGSLDSTLTDTSQAAMSAAFGNEPK